MSRSYKKHPIYKEGYGSKRLQRMKRFSNKKIRHTNNVPDNYEFKKFFESWEIHDYKFRKTEAEFKKDWENEELHPERYGTLFHDKFGTYKKALHCYRKFYRNK